MLAVASSQSSSAGFRFPAVDEDRAVDPKPLFRLRSASDALLLGYRSEGPPARKTWDAESVLASSSRSSSLFRLKAVELPKIEERPGKGTSYSRQDLFQHAVSQLQNGGGGGLTEEAPAGKLAPGGRRQPSVASLEQKPQKRSEKYFQLLMKHHTKRTDGWEDDQEAEAREQAEGAAEAASRAAAKRDRRRASEARSGSQNGGEEVEEERVEEEEVARQAQETGPLVAFDGAMKVDIEIVVLAVPGMPEPSAASSASSPTSARASMAPGDSASSTPRIDLSEELERLKEEMGEDGKSQKTEDSDDMPEGLKLKRLQNIWDNPKPRWSLGLGGTVFFVPDAERYAHGPSLPPPPPPSLQGRRRLRLKPRLPLDISNHRYRDEHPNIWPEAPFSPELQDYVRFEQKLLTLDLYTSCNKALARLPQQERASDEGKHRRLFGSVVEAETKKSQAWKNWNHREDLKKREAEREAHEAAESAAAAEKARLESAAAAAVEEEEMD